MTLLLLEGYFHRCGVCGCVYLVPHHSGVVSSVSEVTRRVVVDSRHDVSMVFQHRPVSVSVIRSFLTVSVFVIAPIDCGCAGKVECKKNYSADSAGIYHIVV